MTTIEQESASLEKSASTGMESRIQYFRFTAKTYRRDTGTDERAIESEVSGGDERSVESFAGV